MHTVENYYKKIAALHEKGIDLHRERCKTSGSYDAKRCTVLVDEIKYLALLISNTEIDLEVDFGKNWSKCKCNFFTKFAKYAWQQFS